MPRWPSALPVGNYERVHSAFRYVDVLAVAGAVVALGAIAVLHRRRRALA